MCYFFCWLLDEYFDTGNRSLKTKANGLHDSGEISALPGSLKCLFLSGCEYAHLAEFTLIQELWRQNFCRIIHSGRLTTGKSWLWLLSFSRVPLPVRRLHLKEHTPLLQKFLRNQDTPLLQKFLCLFQWKLYQPWL